MRGFVLVCAFVGISMLLGSCGAAATALQNSLIQQVQSNLPSSGGSSTPAPAVQPSGSSGDTVIAQTNVSVATMLQNHNALRSQLGLSQFKADATLNLVAQRQAAYMASIGNITHQDASSGQVWDRADAAGYPWRSIGENVAYSTQPTGIFNLWVNSPGHHKNMVNPLYKQIGLGRATSGRAEYWCVVFASR